MSNTVREKTIVKYSKRKENCQIHCQIKRKDCQIIELSNTVREKKRVLSNTFREKRIVKYNKRKDNCQTQ